MGKILLIIMVMSFLSCGKNSQKQGTNKLHRNNIQEHLDLNGGVDGQYLAVFETVNPDISGKITGAFTFSRDKEFDEVVADVRLTNGGAKVIHTQNVRSGSRCPDAKDDLNQDGIIDAAEVEKVMGKILIPLDGDISSQVSHDGEYPIGDIYGNYIYSRVSRFTQFIEDLRSELSEEGYEKLKKNQPFKIEGKVVLIHGVDESVNLPLTVSGYGRRSRHQALPIACGIITKVLRRPGEVEIF